MSNKYNLWLVGYGGYFVIAFLGLLYIIHLFSSDLQKYLTLAASLLITIGLFAGLSFGFSSVIKTSPDKEIAANAGEKFFYATMCMALSFIAGFGAMLTDSSAPTWLWIWVKEITVVLLNIFALMYLFSAAGATIHGHHWITDLFIERWNRRLVGSENGEP